VYVYSPFRVLLQLKSPFCVCAQQVSDLFVVDLNIRGEHQKLNIIRDGYCLEDVFEGSGYDSPLVGRWVNALHRKALTTSSLPIRKHRTVVAF